MVLRLKSVHFNHYKKYEGMEAVVVRTNGPTWKLSSTMSSEDAGGERHEDDLNIPEIEAVSDEETPELSLGEGEAAGDMDLVTEDSGDARPMTGEMTTQRRHYPARERKPPAHFSKYTPWSEIPSDLLK